jgi:LPXTG-motif cell wall-anchored protein
MAPAEPTAAKKLPKTASMWPSLWLASVLSLGLGIFLTLRRRALI